MPKHSAFQWNSIQLFPSNLYYWNTEDYLSKIVWEIINIYLHKHNIEKITAFSFFIVTF